MLERITVDQNPVEWLPSRKHGLQRGRPSQERLTVFTARFRNALRKGVEGIIEAGRVLVEAKSQLEHGQFINWVVDELQFGERRVGKREPNIRKAQMFMFLARHEVISNACNFHAFPPSPRTLWELTQISTKAASSRPYRGWDHQPRHDGRGGSRTQAQDLAGAITNAEAQT